MSTPLHRLDSTDTLQDAALLMSRHGVRHVPVCDGGRLVNIVSERDLFALQRLSLKQLSTRIRAAPDLPSLQQRRGRHPALRAQPARPGRAGAPADRADQPSERRADRVAGAAARARAGGGPAARLLAGLRLRGPRRADGGHRPGQRPRLRQRRPRRPTGPRWLRFARTVNDALDACGYPLCKGNVMASNPACCLSVDEWREPASRTGSSTARREDLLNASIYFDLRPLAGRLELARPLREMLLREPKRVPRFIKQMADNALRNRAPLNWLGAIDTQRGRRSRHGRPEAARHRAVRRRGASVHAGPRPRCIEHARATACRGAGVAAARRPKASRGSRRSSSCRCCACASSSTTRGDDAAPNEVECGSPEPARPPRAEGEPARRALAAAAHRAGLPALTAPMQPPWRRWLTAARGRRRRALGRARRRGQRARCGARPPAGDRGARRAHRRRRAHITLADSFEVVLRQPHDTHAPDKANILLHGIGVGAQRDGVEPGAGAAGVHALRGALAADRFPRRVRPHADRTRPARRPGCRARPTRGSTWSRWRRCCIRRCARVRWTTGWRTLASAARSATRRPPTRWPRPNCCCACGRDCGRSCPCSTSGQPASSHRWNAGCAAEASRWPTLTPMPALHHVSSRPFCAVNVQTRGPGHCHRDGQTQPKGRLRRRRREESRGTGTSHPVKRTIASRHPS